MNYHKELELLLETVEPNQTLLLHSCCAPCSSYVLEYLSNYFAITVFYFNPNITDEAEYYKRENEQRQLIARMNSEGIGTYPISVMQAGYTPEQFYEMVKGLEQELEGGARCELCFEQRLAETARVASRGKYDYFATTLTISPLKNAEKINEIGNRLSQELDVKFLPSDFKKKSGYQRSIELSKKYELYRQDYCGCIYSKLQRERDRNNQTEHGG